MGRLTAAQGPQGAGKRSPRPRLSRVQTGALFLALFPVTQRLSQFQIPGRICLGLLWQVNGLMDTIQPIAATRWGLKQRKLLAPQFWSQKAKFKV